MAVIATVELQNDVALRCGSRQPYGAHRRLRAARHEPKHRDVRHSVDDQFGERHLQLSWNTEARSATHRCAERIDYARRRMPEHERTPGQDVVDVLASVDVPNPGTL